jgi:hypothetical protein
MADSRTPVLKQVASSIADEPRKDLRLRKATLCALRSLIRLLAQQAARETTREQASRSLPSAADVGP